MQTENINKKKIRSLFYTLVVIDDWFDRTERFIDMVTSEILNKDEACLMTFFLTVEPEFIAGDQLYPDVEHFLMQM